MSKNKREDNYGPSPVLMWIFVIILLAVLFLLINSSLFNVTEISVEGNKRFTGQEIITASGITTDINIIHIDEVEVKQKIEQNAFIQVEDIVRVFPTKIVIKVSERTPAAQIAVANGDFYVIDAKGIALGLNRAQDSSLPTIYEMDIVQPEYGKNIISSPKEKIDNLLYILNAVEKYSLEGKITGINLKNPQEIALTYEGKYTIQMFDGYGAEQKLKHIEVIVESVKDELEKGKVLYLNSEGGHYIK